MIRELNNIKKYNLIKDNVFNKIIALYEKEEVIAYLSYNLLYDRIDICNIYVDELYRNMGKASQLLEYLINYANNNKLINISLEVNSLNKPAIKLYEKYGFVKKATRRAYYKGIDGYLYVKELV